MSTPAVVAKVAVAEGRELLRRLAREALGDRVSIRTSATLAGSVLSVVTVVLAWRALDTGRQLGSGFGPGLLAALFTASGVALGMTALIGTHVWSRSTSVERERLAVLPLGPRALSALAAVPAMVPTALGLYVALPSILVLAFTTRIAPTTLVGSFALGFALPATLAVVWTVPMVVLRPRRDLAVVALVAASLAALLGHALWLMSQGDVAFGWARLNPLVWVLTNEEDYSAAASALGVGLLAASVAALGALRRVRARQQPRTRLRRRRATLDGWLPAGPRVWTGLVRVVWRRSSLVSEIGVAAVLGAVVCFFASVLLVQDRFIHGYTALLVAAGFSALPLLGVPGALGPISRLTQMGMRPADIRLGVAGAGALFHLVSLLPGAAVLVWRGVRATDLIVLFALAVVTFGITLSVGTLLRRITASSLGRTLGVAVAMVPFFGVAVAGLPSWPVPGILAAAVGSSAFLALTLGGTVRQRSFA